MKTILSALALLCLTAFFAAPLVAQTTAADSTKCFEVVGTSDYYFGVIDADNAVEHTFIFKNNCKQTIEVDRAQASCGCTAAILSEKVIKPGAEAKVQVKFTPPKGTKGKVSKTVSVFLKNQPQPQTVLRFSAEVKVDVDIQPNYVNLLGAEVGTPVSAKTTVKNMTTEDIEITEVSFTATSYTDTSKGKTGTQVALPLGTTSVTPATFTLKPNESKEVTMTVTPEHEGSINGSLRVKTKKNDSFIQVWGVVRAKTQGEIKVEDAPAAPQHSQGADAKGLQEKGTLIKQVEADKTK